MSAAADNLSTVPLPSLPNIRVDRARVIRAAKLAQQAVGNPPNPELKSVVLSYDRGMLKLTSTDLDVELTATMPAWPAGSYPSSGSTAVNRIGLARDLAALGGDHATIECSRDDVDGHTNVIAAGDVTIRRKRPGIPMVTLSDRTFDVQATWTPADLERLAWVATAASTDEGRPVLTGVNLDDGMAAATDSYRLFAAPVPTFNDEALIPGRIVRLLAKAAASSDITVSVSDDLVRFEWSRHDINWQLVAHQIQGSFPNWRKLLFPRLPDEVVPNVPAARIAAIGRRHTAIHQPGTGPSVPVELSTGPAGSLRARSERGRTVVDECVPTIAWDQPPVAISGRLLASIAGGFTAADGNVHLQVEDELKPLTVTDGQCHALIMPIRLN